MSKLNNLNTKKTEAEDDKIGEINTQQTTTIDELTQQNQEYLAGWQRAKADYLNLKKESDEIIAKLRSAVRAEIFLEWLPYWQNLITAIAHIPVDLKDTDWAQGFIHIQRQIESWLLEHGVKKIKTVGEKFDYELHEAVETVWDEQVATDEIVQEKSPGFEYQGQVIIHPKVVVNTPTDTNK